MPDELERRRTGRHRTYKGAKIILNNNQSVIDCVVRSESSDGVRLKVASIVGVPDEFPLKIMDQPAQPCRVVWRSATELGVVFIAP